MTLRRHFFKMDKGNCVRTKVRCAQAKALGGHYTTPGEAKAAYFDSMTVPQLKKEAARLEIVGRSSMTKPELIAALVN